MNLEQEKDNWLKEVANRCDKYAREIDLDFYVFQTPVIFNPRLLLIGINPGNNISYSKMLELKGYDKRPYNDLGYDINLLTEKPSWETGKGSDVIRERLKRIFNKNNSLDILNESMMMNMFYFNTTKEKDISPISSEIKNYCIEKTLEIIKIINPKNILFLTSANSNLQKCAVKEIKSIDNNIKSGILDSRQVYAIPHYGAYGAYSYENAEKTGLALSKLFI